MQSFDAAYIDRLRNRDPDTEQHFVAYFTDLIRIKLRARAISPQLIEDIQQETFLRVLRAVRSGKGIRRPESLGAYVHSVCHNVLLEHLRARGRHPSASEEAVEALPEASGGADDRLISEERKAEVRRIVDDLPARDRGVLRAVFLEDRDRDEICARLGVGRGYLRVLLHRAKTEFRNGFLTRHGDRDGYGFPGGRSPG